MVQISKTHKKYIKWFWGVFVISICGILFLFQLAGWGFFGDMPTFEELENPRTDLAAQIISSDGVQLGTIFKPNENRTPINYKDLPEHLVQALIATEDVRFYKHSGIDARGTIRAISAVGSRGGASTITQQLAKQLFTGGSNKLSKRIAQKIQEWVIAIRLERQYTKNEIIEMYLNKYDFIYQAIGIGSASRIYFSKKPKDLTIEEAAVLIGMLKSAVIYNPKSNPKKSIKRRNTVLAQMAKYGYITTIEKDSLQQLPLQLHFMTEGYSSGSATYARKYIKDWVGEWIKKNPKKEKNQSSVAYYNLYRDGLKVFVTIDSRLQKHAEAAVKEHLANLQNIFDVQEKDNATFPYTGISEQQIQAIINESIRSSERRRVMLQKGYNENQIIASFDIKTKMKLFSWQGNIDTIMTPRDSILYYKRFLHTGLLSIKPKTGEIKAWVGGINHHYFKYDHVYQAKRQVGSTFKPFVYATAIDQLKLSPCHEEPKSKIIIPIGKHGVANKAWIPTNTDNDYIGLMTLKDALAGSVNTISARLMDKVGPETVIRLVRKMGIRSPIKPVASISLGTESLTLSEMVGAYSTFANEGIYNTPTMITRIEDKNGNVLYKNSRETRDVINKQAAYATINLMEGVTQTGSGQRLRTDISTMNKAVTGYPYGFTNPIAGKTGTTQNHSDGWFIGMVPNLCTGVWVGGEHRATHFSSVIYGQGATMALPIWGLYMKKCYTDENLVISQSEFEKPENLSIEMDCDVYKKNKKEKSELVF